MSDLNDLQNELADLVEQLIDQGRTKLAVDTLEDVSDPRKTELADRLIRIVASDTYTALKVLPQLEAIVPDALARIIEVALIKSNFEVAPLIERNRNKEFRSRYARKAFDKAIQSDTYHAEEIYNLHDAGQPAQIQLFETFLGQDNLVKAKRYVPTEPKFQLQLFRAFVAKSEYSEAASMLVNGLKGLPDQEFDDLIKELTNEWNGTRTEGYIEIWHPILWMRDDARKWPVAKPVLYSELNQDEPDFTALEILAGTAPASEGLRRKIFDAAVAKGEYRDIHSAWEHLNEGDQVQVEQIWEQVVAIEVQPLKADDDQKIESRAHVIDFYLSEELRPAARKKLHDFALEEGRLQYVAGDIYEFAAATEIAEGLVDVLEKQPGGYQEIATTLFELKPETSHAVIAEYQQLATTNTADKTWATRLLINNTPKTKAKRPGPPAQVTHTDIFDLDFVQPNSSTPTRFAAKISQ